MNIEKGKSEFEEGNYEDALTYFEQVGSDNEHYEFAQLFVANCLMELKRYDSSLMVVDRLISLNPQNKLAWFNRAMCQIFLKDEDGALETIGEILRIMDMESEYDLVFVAKLYKLLNLYDDALKFCDLALKIDGNFKEALYEKALIGMEAGDYEIVDDVSQKLFDLSDNGVLGFIPVFLLKLLSKKYSDCVKLIDNVEDERLDGEHVKMFKAIIYQRICDDLCVDLLVVNSEDFSLDNALEAMIDFVESEKDNGEIDGVQYYII